MNLNIKTTHRKGLRKVNVLVLFIQINDSSPVFPRQSLPPHYGGDVNVRSEGQCSIYICISMLLMPFTTHICSIFVENSWPWKLFMLKSALVDLTVLLFSNLPEAGSPMRLTVEERMACCACVVVCVSCFWVNERCVSCCQPACQRQAAPVHSRGSSLQLGYIDDE